MSDFFTRLAGRALHQTPVLEPLVAAWTAPVLDEVEPELEQVQPDRRPRVVADAGARGVVPEASARVGSVAVRGRLEAAGSAAGSALRGSGPESSPREVEDERAVVRTGAEGHEAAVPRMDRDEAPRPRRQAAATVTVAPAAEATAPLPAAKAPAPAPEPATKRLAAGVSARDSRGGLQGVEPAAEAAHSPSATTLAPPVFDALDSGLEQRSVAQAAAASGSVASGTANVKQAAPSSRPEQRTARTFLRPGPRQQPAAHSEPTITVSIGRIEVRAAPQRAPLPLPAEPARPRTRPKVSLDDYLAQRSGRGSGSHR